jgi:hypothetical protein
LRKSHLMPVSGIFRILTGYSSAAPAWRPENFDVP